MERIYPGIIPHHTVLLSGERPQINKVLVGEIESLADVQPKPVGLDINNNAAVETTGNVIFQSDHSGLRGSEHMNPILDQVMSLQNGLDYSRKKKPSGRKQERRREKLPNHIRHDENAAIAIGTWKKRSKKQTEKGKSVSDGI